MEKEPFHPKNSDEPKKEREASARYTAFRALRAIKERGLFIDVALELQRDYTQRLNPQDRSFARWIVATVVRHEKRLEHILSRFWRKPPPDHIRLILCSGLAQLLLGNNPSHAVVSETVSLCGKDDDAYRGLVNGILRNALREDISDFHQLDPALEYPSWMVRDWERTFGAETAKKIMIESLKEADMDLSFSRNEKEAILHLKKARPLPGGGARLKDHKGRVSRLKGFREGLFWIQDAAAQIPVKLMGDVAGKTVLDLCAAPGGKSLQLASKGAQVTALDLKELRMQRLQDNFERMKLDVEIVICDALEYEPEHQFDIVLVDPPCSATGTLRRHPEVLWQTKKKEDIAELNALQSSMLQKASSFVADQGILTYATCSLQYNEGPKVIQDFLAQNPNWESVNLQEKASELKIDKALCDEGWIYLHPALWEKIGGMDGFFISILKKKS